MAEVGKVRIFDEMVGEKQGAKLRMDGV